MKKDTITLDLGDESMRVEAYLSSTPGLAIHRQVVYLPGKEEHKFSSKWQITHIESGKGLFRPSECVETMTHAEEIAKRLKDHDWERPREEIPESAKEAHEQALQGVQPVKTSGSSKRYFVRRNTEGAGYVVWDDDTNAVVETFVHRGLASQKAKELNGTVST